ncbi:hypothetical protein [Microbacterium sp. NPDC056569]|uniref:hypothetical protein n=1 Tax=Microbacterium sp. NPDC056569 TaxID=3345867 RepID=UPI0036705CA0
MDNPTELRADEVHALGEAIVRGATRLEAKRLRRRNIAAGSIAVAMIVGVAGAAFAAPYLLPAPIAGPTPTTTESTSPTPAPTPTPTVATEPLQLSVAQTEADLVPDDVTGAFDRSTTRLVGIDEGTVHFVARGTAADAPYCLVLVPETGSAGWAAACGTLAGTRVQGPAVGESQLSLPGTSPEGWRALDGFVSVNPNASKTPVDSPQTEAPPPPDEYGVAQLQTELDGIGADVAAAYDTTQPGYDPTQFQQNQSRQAQTEALAAQASQRLGGPVALIRPTYVGFPDEATGAPNSVMWWVVTSQPTEFAFSYVHRVNGTDWTGWGQGDRNAEMLAQRLTTWLAQNQPGVNWTIVIQSH